jgi:uncharacterized protein (DUF427 family)
MEQTDKPVRKQRFTPGPDHPITVEKNPKRVVVVVAGEVIADSKNALTLREGTYPPVQYIPRQDVKMSLLTRTTHQTYCPYKGECNYFSLQQVGERGENAVWTYETPYEAVSGIKDHLAFYPNRVDSIQEH